MKTSKRKRSAKTAPAAEAAGVEVVAAATVVLEAVAETSINDVAAEVVDAHADTVVAETIEPVAAEPVVVLNSNCTVKDAAALKVSLCAIAKHSDAVTVDVSAVERVDTATMQLLCAFVRDRSGRKQSITWRGESQALQDAVRLLGIGALLGFDSKGVAA